MQKLVLIILASAAAGCGEQGPADGQAPQAWAEAVASHGSEPQTSYADVPTPEQKLAMQQRYQSQNIRGLDQNDNLQAEGELLSFLNARPGSREEAAHWRAYQSLVERGAANTERAYEESTARETARIQREGETAAARFRSACQSPETLTADETRTFLSFAMLNRGRARAAGLEDPAWQGCEARVEARHSELARESNRLRQEAERLAEVERKAAEPRRERRIEFTAPPSTVVGPPAPPPPSAPR